MSGQASRTSIGQAAAEAVPARSGSVGSLVAHPAEACLLVATLLWSLNPTAVKVGVTQISPLVYPLLRFGFGGLALMVIVRLREGSLRVARADLPLLALTGLVGVTINQACFVYALTNTQASDVAFLSATGPLLTALLATAVGVEHLARRHWVGAVAGLGGVALIIASSPPANVGESSLLGAVLALGAAASSSASALPIRSLLRRYSPWRILTYELLFGSLLLLPFAMPSLATQDFTHVSPVCWAALSYGVIFTGIVTNVLYFTAIGQIGPSRASMYGYLQSFLAVLFAVVLLGEHVVPLELVGGVVIIVGIAVARQGHQRAAMPERRIGARFRCVSRYRPNIKH
jgi:drug/metabolite transporter (DMT)-like permease